VPAPPLRSQSDSARAASASLPVHAVTTPAAVPFPVGERLRYGARYGPFSVGKATMEVAGLDTVDGVETVHFIFRIEGGALWYHLDQTMESWVGRTDFRSRRFHQDTEERGRIWHHYYDIFPEKAAARMWLSDAARRVMLALQSNFSFGQITLKLKEYSVPEHP